MSLKDKAKDLIRDVERLLDKVKDFEREAENLDREKENLQSQLSAKK